MTRPAPGGSLLGRAWRRVRGAAPDANPGGAVATADATAADRLGFIIAGAQRCGTSSMVRHLSAHPEIGFIAEPDCTHEGEPIGWPFASPVLAHYARGYDESLYTSMAARLAGTVKVIATKQPYFMVYPHVPFGLREQLPDVKLLFLLRNQADAIHSTFRISKAEGRMQQHDSVASLVDWSPEADAEDLGEDYRLPAARNTWYKRYWRETRSKEDRTPFILDRYFYYEQLVRFFHVFPREQLKIVAFDDFAAEPARVLREICTFLDVDPDFAFPDPAKRHSASPDSEPLDPDVRAAILDFYAESNARLFDLLDWPADRWRPA